MIKDASSRKVIAYGGLMMNIVSRDIVIRIESRARKVRQ